MVVLSIAIWLLDDCHWFLVDSHWSCDEFRWCLIDYHRFLDKSHLFSIDSHRVCIDIRCFVWLMFMGCFLFHGFLLMFNGFPFASVVR